MRRLVGAAYSLSSSWIVSIDHINELAEPAYTNCQVNAAEFIDNVQELERPAIHRLVELWASQVLSCSVPELSSPTTIQAKARAD
jgi:hypothetical protein